MNVSGTGAINFMTMTRETQSHSAEVVAKEVKTSTKNGEENTIKDSEVRFDKEAYVERLKEMNNKHLDEIRENSNKNLTVREEEKYSEKVREEEKFETLATEVLQPTVANTATKDISVVDNKETAVGNSQEKLKNLHDKVTTLQNIFKDEEEKTEVLNKEIKEGEKGFKDYDYDKEIIKTSYFVNPELSNVFQAKI